MSLPDIINVAIGVVFLYLLLSTIGSALAELATRTLRYREEILIVTVNSLLTGLKDITWPKSKLLWDRAARTLVDCIPNEKLRVWIAKRIVPKETPLPTTGSAEKDAINATITKRFWEHPKIQGISSNSIDVPTSIDTETFARVLVDIAIPKSTQGSLPSSKVKLERTLDVNADHIPESLQGTLLALAKTSDIAESATGTPLWNAYYKAIQDWYDESMRAATDRYRRCLHAWLLYIGFAMAFLLNADSIRVVYLLAIDSELSRNVADAVEAEMDKLGLENLDAAATDAEVKATAKAAMRSVQQLGETGFPIGWTGNRAFDWYPFSQDPEPSPAATPSTFWRHTLGGISIGVYLYKLIGLLITAFAVGQGAPFWYNLLKRILEARKSIAGKDSSKEPETAAEVMVASAGNRAEIATATVGAGEKTVPLEIVRDFALAPSGFDKRKAYWLAEASLLAYRDEAQVKAKVINDWLLPSPVCWDENEIGTQAFAMRTDDVAIVAFRGTEPTKLDDWLSDARFKLTPFSDLPGRLAGVQVHSGFKAALATLYPKITAWLELPEIAGKPLYITGHSLGGALSTMLAAQLCHVGHPAAAQLSVYNFGCPRVGDRAFAAELGQLVGGRLYRVIHGNDLVTAVPPAVEYRHLGQTLTFLKDGTSEFGVTSLDRFMGFLIAATDNVTTASLDSLKDHGMENYVLRSRAFSGAELA